MLTRHALVDKIALSSLNLFSFSIDIVTPSIGHVIFNVKSMPVLLFSGDRLAD